MISLPQSIKVVNKQGNKASFEIEGLHPGYGITLGNSLRRILLSSLEGAAITEVKIKNVLHEFSTPPGVLEDVIMILLNLKKLRFKLHTDEPQTASLSVKGEKQVKAQDFKLSSQVELANPQEHIATLTKSTAELNLEVVIEKGLGYQSIESREKEKTEVGALPLDAIFTPVEKVSFAVENMRVGKRTDFDRLKIEIETDGTLTPEEALLKSADILVEHFSFVSAGLAKKAKPEKQKQSAGKEKTTQADDGKKMKVEDLKISERTKSALTKAGIKSLSGLLRKSKQSLSELEGMGEKGIEETAKALKKLGFELK